MEATEPKKDAYYTHKRRMADLLDRLEAIVDRLEGNLDPPELSEALRDARAAADKYIARRAQEMNVGRAIDPDA